MKQYILSSEFIPSYLTTVTVRADLDFLLFSGTFSPFLVHSLHSAQHKMQRGKAQFVKQSLSSPTFPHISHYDCSVVSTAYSAVLY